jgi:hypothetical protein
LLGCAAGSPVELWFQDEARVGQQGTHAYVWAPVGSRPAMVRDNRRQSAYLFGAICPDRGVGAAIISPVANTIAMNHHLAEVSTQLAPGAIAVLLTDGAGSHQIGGRLRVRDNIRLLRLPSSSPELNSMENVWAFLRANKLCNRVWETFEEIVDAREAAWRFLTNDTDHSPSIGHREGACVSSWAGWYERHGFANRRDQGQPGRHSQARQRAAKCCRWTAMGDRQNLLAGRKGSEPPHHAGGQLRRGLAAAGPEGGGRIDHAHHGIALGRMDCVPALALCTG